MIQETSRQSYLEIRDQIGARQRQVLDALEILQEATDFEIAKFIGRDDPNYVRPRRNELVNKHKLVGFSQKRKCGITGRTCLAWKIL